MTKEILDFSFFVAENKNYDILFRLFEFKFGEEWEYSLSFEEIIQESDSWCPASIEIDGINRKEMLEFTQKLKTCLLDGGLWHEFHHNGLNSSARLTVDLDIPTITIYTYFKFDQSRQWSIHDTKQKGSTSRIMLRNLTTKQISDWANSIEKTLAS